MAAEMIGFRAYGEIERETSTGTHELVHLVHQAAPLIMRKGMFLINLRLVGSEFELTISDVVSGSELHTQAWDESWEGYKGHKVWESLKISNSGTIGYVYDEEEFDDVSNSIVVVQAFQSKMVRVNPHRYGWLDWEAQGISDLAIDRNRIQQGRSENSEWVFFWDSKPDGTYGLDYGARAFDFQDSDPPKTLSFQTFERISEKECPDAAPIGFDYVSNVIASENFAVFKYPDALRVWKFGNSQDLSDATSPRFIIRIPPTGYEARIDCDSENPDVCLDIGTDCVPIAITNDQKWILVQHPDTLRIWNLETADVEKSFASTSFQYGGFSPQEDLIAILDDKGTIRIWRRSDGQELRSLHAQPAGILDFEFSADGVLILARCDDGYARIWVVQNGDLLSALNHAEPIRICRFGEESDIVVTVGDCFVRTWAVWGCVDGTVSAQEKTQLNTIEDRTGTTALLTAVRLGSAQQVSSLISHGSNVLQANPRTGAFPLLEAVERDRIDIVRILISGSANVEQTCTKTGLTPLLAAIDRMLPEIVHELLEQGADPNGKADEAGNSPILYALNRWERAIDEECDGRLFTSSLHRTDEFDYDAQNSFYKRPRRIVESLLEFGAELDASSLSSRNSLLKRTGKLG